MTGRLRPLGRPADLPAIRVDRFFGQGDRHELVVGVVEPLDGPRAHERSDDVQGISVEAGGGEGPCQEVEVEAGEGLPCLVGVEGS